LKQTFGHFRVASRTPATCYLEMRWAMLGAWLLALMTGREVVARRGDPRRLSPAAARNVVRRVLRGQPPHPRSKQALSRVLAGCLIDQYERHHSKASRNYPRKKHQTPPNPPIIKLPTTAQLHKAKQLTPIVLLV
jgi:hypothetical protein